MIYLELFACYVAALIIVPPVVLGVMARLWRTGHRRGSWYWRWWWFYGYECGFYRINWAWKRRHT